ncbi:MAG: RNA ligase (ATP) [Rectinemataceae bacterium]
MPRKLASIQSIREVLPIEGADAIERVGILGWYCVAKKGEFREGDNCLYFEIDSLLPEWPEYEFLRKSSWSEKARRFRLKTAKLRGALSQGLALPIARFAARVAAAGLGSIEDLPAGTDLTDALDVEKYEAPVSVQLDGKARDFSWPIAKSDEVRLESDPELLAQMAGKPWYISAKLDGTSASFILDLPGEPGSPGEFHVCSRNLSLEEDPGNIYWKLARKLDIEEILRSHFAATGTCLAIQGELCGPGIQGNKLGLSEAGLFVFTIVEVGSRRFLDLEAMRSLCAVHGLHTVPILREGDSFAFSTEELFAMSEYPYREVFPEARKDQEGEGIVVRAKDQSLSFKKVSNRFLLKGGE